MNVRSKIVASTSFLTAFLFLSAFAEAQSSRDESKTARLIDSFGPVPSGDMRGRTDLFLAELANNPKSTGVVINHGTPALIVARKRYFQNHIGFRSFDASRISFRPGVNVGDVRTDMWLIPENGTQPEIKPEARIAVSFQRISKVGAERKIKQFFALPELCGDHQGYIINYGTPVQIKQREKWIVESINFRRFDCSRITLVNGGKGPVRTVMWLVPPGAKNPDV